MYELREMTASQRDKYMDNLGDRMKVAPDGTVVGMKKFDGMQADLLHRCLFLSDKPVAAETIQSWPASAVTELFLLAQKLNKLNQEPAEVREEIKND